LKHLSSIDHQRCDSLILERLKLAAEDETFALEFIKQNGLDHLLKLFSPNFDSYSKNLLRSLQNIMTNQEIISWDDLQPIETIVQQLIVGVNASKVSRLHASSAMIILHSMINNESKYSSTILKTLNIQCLLDYCTKQHDVETQFYALALINVIMSKGDSTLRSSFVTTMSFSYVSTRLRELVQTVIVNEENSNNESFSYVESTGQSPRHLTRSSLVQQLCLLQRFYLNELYTNPMNTSPDRSDTKCRDMISELRRSAFDTDLLLTGQSCQDLSQTSPISSTINPRRVEALQRDYERLGFQDLREPIKDFQKVPPGLLSLQNLFYFCIQQKNDFIRFVLENSCKTLQQQCPLVKSAIEVTRILCTLFSIGIEPNLRQIQRDYFLLFFTISSFFEQTFVRSIVLFNKTWKEMRASEIDFLVVSSIVQQQISQSLDDISLLNCSNSNPNKTIVSLSSNFVQRFTFEYFIERLNTNNYKDICRRRDEFEMKREEIIMKLPVVEILKERLKSQVESLTRQSRLKRMKQGETFMTIETRPGAKKAKNRLMFWQLLDNEKSIQCSESSTKETNPRDSSSGTTTSLARLMIPVEAIRDVQCTTEQSRNGSLIHLSERVPKSIRNSNAHLTLTINLHSDVSYTLLGANNYDMSCWSDGFNILLHKEIETCSAREEMESLLTLLCQIQMLELDNPSIVLPQYQISVPNRFPPRRSSSTT